MRRPGEALGVTICANENQRRCGQQSRPDIAEPKESRHRLGKKYGCRHEQRSAAAAEPPCHHPAELSDGYGPAGGALILPIDPSVDNAIERHGGAAGKAHT